MLMFGIGAAAGASLIVMILGAQKAMRLFPSNRFRAVALRALILVVFGGAQVALAGVVGALRSGRLSGSVIGLVVGAVAALGLATYLWRQELQEKGASSSGKGRTEQDPGRS